MSTIRDHLLSNVELARPAVVAGDLAWSWADYVAQAARRSHTMTSLLDADRPLHVGILAENTPEMAFQLGAAGLGSHVLVGLNSTRRGEGLMTDILTADCQIVLCEPAHVGLLDGLVEPLAQQGVQVMITDQVDWGQDTSIPLAEPEDSDLFMLVFTSGTSGKPKAVRITHAKVTYPGAYLTEKLGLSGDDVCYSAMPLFHSNGVMANWALGVVNGSTMVLARRFSASSWLDDIRRHHVTYFNYVGKPLTYILATAEREDDFDNPLRLAFGNEAGERDVARFGRRFGCAVVDGFGSSENAVVIARTPDTPPSALGRPLPGIKILDPVTGNECPPAIFDASGRVLNLDEATGEMVNTLGAGQFAGYYNDDAANAERMRGGMYWSGDLAYADSDGFYYFAGRTADWLRVDGENLAAAPVEAIFLRHPAISQAAVYALPDDAGDLLATALVLKPGATLDPTMFEEFLSDQQDLSPKAWPRVVRLVDTLPSTATNKILKRELAGAGLNGGVGELWQREPRGTAFSRR